MRLAVFADIHGNHHALSAMLDDLNSVGDLDQIWCLGDCAAFGTQPAASVAALRALRDEHGKETVKVIGGNTDTYLVTGKRPVVPAAKDAEGLAKRQTTFAMRDDVLNWTLNQLTWDDYDFLAGIIGRETRTRAEGYGAIIGYHAIPGDDEPMSLRPDTADEEAADALLDRAGRLAIGGHTHIVMDRTVGTWRVLNPGSVGLSFTQYGKAEWALITIDGDRADVDFRTVDYDVDALLSEAESSDYPHPAFLQDLVNRAQEA